MVRLATLPDGTRDGALWVVSADGTRALSARAIAPNLLRALDDWDELVGALRVLAAELDEDSSAGEPFDEKATLAPLPRTWQWLDASAYLNHGDIMARSLGIEPIVAPRPLMYQGMSHEFIPPHGTARRWSDDGDLDFEGEFAVILRDVAAGVSPEEALQGVALVAVVNDWSQRAVVRTEISQKFGFIEGKPASGMAPLVVTPDELGGAWRDGRIDLSLTVDLNGDRFGSVSASEMDYSFGELISCAARARNLAAGTVLGSGTVSSRAYAEVGSACIAERRGIEIIKSGRAVTPYLRVGDEVSMRVDAGGRSLFGGLRQTVV